jgi:hypothetical protein
VKETRPSPDPQTDGKRVAAAQQAVLWLHSARRLLATGYPDVALGFIAAYLSVRNASQLIDGWGAVRSDDVARKECPDVRGLHGLRDRLAEIRNALLHFTEERNPVTLVETSFRSNPPTLTLNVTEEGKRPRRLSMTRAEVQRVLDEIEPWLVRQEERLRQLTTVGSVTNRSA